MGERWVSGEFVHVTTAKAATLASNLARPGDIVFTQRGTLGQVSLVPHGPHESYLVSQSQMKLTVDHEVADPVFFYYVFRSDEQQAYIRQRAIQGGVPHTNLGILRTTPVPLPPLPVQHAIARILGALDDKIELNRKMNETLEQMARAIFKSWFVDFEPFHDKGMVGSPSGKIPEGWGTQSLYDCAEFVNGAAYSDFDFAPDRTGLPVVKISELKDGVTPQTKFTHTDLGAKHRIDSRDMLYSWSGSPDTSLDVFTWMGGPAWLNQHIFRVDLHSNCERCFVYCLLRMLKPTLVEIARDKQTTGLGHVTTRDMKDLRVVKAPADVLRKFEESVGPIYDRRMLNESESRTLAAIRDALLPKLMSGEVRVMS